MKQKRERVCCVRVCMNVYVCMCVSACMCVCVLHIYIGIYIYGTNQRPADTIAATPAFSAASIRSLATSHKTWAHGETTRHGVTSGIESNLA